jgi:predicted enzyme related to lactoylglutathione lyase
MLRSIPYIFLYVAELSGARRFYEDVLGLPVAETDSFSAKYDCGSVMLALNVVTPLAADPEAMIVFSVPDLNATRQQLESHGVPAASRAAATGLGSDSQEVSFADPDGHQLRIVQADVVQAGAAAGYLVTEVRLSAPDLNAVRTHYGEVLALAEIGTSAGQELQYDAGRFRLCIRAGSAPGPGRPAASYVFHTDDCSREQSALIRRGLEVTAPQSGDIGVTARFLDPAGHDFYLYQPSSEALAWPSGPVYRRIIELDSASAVRGESRASLR